MLWCYIDHLVNACPEFNTHLDILGKVFQQCRSMNLKLNLEKKQLYHSEVKLLENIARGEGVGLDPILFINV